MANSATESLFHVKRICELSRPDSLDWTWRRADVGFTWNQLRHQPEVSLVLEEILVSRETGTWECSKVGMPTIGSKTEFYEVIRTDFALFHVKQLASAQNLC